MLKLTRDVHAASLVLDNTYIRRNLKDPKLSSLSVVLNISVSDTFNPHRDKVSAP